MKWCDRPLHVALCTRALDVGGVEKSFIEMSNALLDAGCCVDLLLLAKEGELLGEIDRRVRIVDLGKRRALSAVPDMAVYLRGEWPDVLISASCAMNQAAALAKLASGATCHLLMGTHTDPAIEFSVQKNRKNLIQRPIARMLYGLADGHIAVSREAGDRLKEMFRLPAGKVHTVYNPVDQARVGDSVESSHPWLRESGKGKVIVSAGRLVYQKDHATLLRAFREVLEVHPDTRLVIFGEGPERGALEALVQDLSLVEHVSMPGYANPVRAEIAAGDLFVLSSTTEGLPTVLIEALIEGTPVVSTRCEFGAAEILEDGRWGHLSPCSDPRALAQAIMKGLDEPISVDLGAVERFSRTSFSNEIMNIIGRKG